jgi:ribosomal protein S27AE
LVKCIGYRIVLAHPATNQADVSNREVDMNCPKCGSGDWMPATDESFAACNDCGFTEYDEWTLSIQAEAKREYEEAKQYCWPDPVPSYREYKQMRGELRD